MASQCYFAIGWACRIKHWIDGIRLPRIHYQRQPCFFPLIEFLPDEILRLLNLPFKAETSFNKDNG
jgi:hypothetical protein